jgi:hypothetical protein
MASVKWIYLLVVLAWHSIESKADDDDDDGGRMVFPDSAEK